MNLPHYLFLFFFLLSCSRGIEPRSKLQSYGLVPADLAELKELIHTNDIRSVEHLVATTKSILPNTVLLYDSMSRHRVQTTFQNPRVISSSSDSNFVMAWVGDDGTKLADSVETMFFNREKRSFVFNEIVFTDKGPKFSEDNESVSGKSCLSCHQPQKRTSDQIDPRPIWEPYPYWFGAYGSIFDPAFRRSVLEGKFSVLDDKVQPYLQSLLKKSHRRHMSLAAFMKGLKRMSDTLIFPTYQINTPCSVKIFS